MSGGIPFYYLTLAASPSSSVICRYQLFLFSSNLYLHHSTKNLLSLNFSNYLFSYYLRKKNLLFFLREKRGRGGKRTMTEASPQLTPEEEKLTIRDIAVAAEAQTKVGDTFYLITQRYYSIRSQIALD